MSDLEMTRLCAEAMGWHTGKLASKVVAYDVNKCAIIAGNDRGGESIYDPLHDDSQSMALVKRFRLRVDYFDADSAADRPWRVRDGNIRTVYMAHDLNRAIVECVAKMQQAQP